MQKKVILLGYNETAKKLTRYFEEEGTNTEILGFIDDKRNVNELSHYPIFSDINKTMDICLELKADEIYSTIMPEYNKEVYNIISEAEKECIRFRFVPDFSLLITKALHVEYFKDLPILSLRNEPLDDVGNRFKKRVLDIIVSFFVVMFILPWMIPLIGLLIFLDSRGPIFYSQIRIGKNNKPFYCFKFRSMKANKVSDAKQATKKDPRITRVGKFLRKTSIDEFPQFINVLTGEMSLVGPRPHPVNLNDKYKKIVDKYAVRQFLKPGITGWAQVNGYRGEIIDVEKMEKRIKYDLLYMEKWTLWLDIQILFLTIYYVIKGDKNAY